jgi:hypothetical protein
MISTHVVVLGLWISTDVEKVRKYRLHVNNWKAGTIECVCQEDHVDYRGTVIALSASQQWKSYR